MRPGRGGFSWWSVLSLVPGIWEDPPLGTFLPAGGRGGVAHHSPRGPTLHAGLEEAQAGIKIAGRNINNLRYTDDTTLMAESEEDLKILLMKVKEE